MLRLPEFKFRTATSVAEVTSLLANEGGTTRVVAGGTDLWPNLKRRHQQADTVVSLNGLNELKGITGDPGGEIRIGATVLLNDIVDHDAVRAEHPAVTRAVQSISSPVLRNMGTIGGNLCLDTRCTYYNQNEEWRQSISYCMKEEGSTCWVAPNSPRCWAISASDAAPMLCALGARVRLVSHEGERVIPVRELYNDDGIAYLTKRHDELITDIFVPPAGASRSAFWKLRRRGSIDFAVLTAAATLETDASGGVTRADIYLGAVGSHPIRVKESEAVLMGQPLTAENIAEAARVSRKDGTPLNNTDFIPQWRSRMIEKYVEAVLRECAGLPVERMAPRHGFGAA